MRKLFLAILALFFCTTMAFAQTYVDGYYRKNGTYVAPHYRSSPNSSVTDNYSYKGNRNPYSGQTGDNYYRNSPSSGYYGTSSSRSSYGSYGTLGSSGSRRNSYGY